MPAVRELQVEDNQRVEVRGPIGPSPDLEARTARFVREEAGFAQVVTINRAGYPVARTMVAVLGPDWQVQLVQRSVHRRIAQLRKNPAVEVIWSGTPAPDSVNDRPHVYDFGLLIPRVVFVRGQARRMDDATLVDTYERQTERQRSLGWKRAPLRSRDDVVAELVGIEIDAVQVRVEGFGPGATSYTWRVGEPA